ncbi:unnamed protein product [Caenorhabditis angaria]|uniref:Uncharacterized protein n=1 Tax=Caenorhabditis angaria TaxID=860376 RepID=A0A9P1N6H9_9PELO|nr:unnamed protein product [Caenorhabditis angaria]
MNTERGIVVGLAADCKFVATKTDVVLMRPDVYEYQLYQLGDCLKFSARSFVPRNELDNCHRRIISCERCEKFVEWENKHRTNNIAIISEIVGVTMKRIPYSNRIVRCFQTNFLEEVYEIGEQQSSKSVSDYELSKMKVVATRVLNDQKKFIWCAVNLKPILFGNNENKMIQPAIKKERITLKGIVLDFLDDLREMYIWVPGRSRKILIPLGFRDNYPINFFHGTWLEFSVDVNYRIDRNTSFQKINDYFPTRFLSSKRRWEIRVSVYFDCREWNGNRNVELESGECGIIIDELNVLKSCNRLFTFSDDAWVFCDRGGFILSDKQEHWTPSGSIRFGSGSSFEEEDLPSSSTETSRFYVEESPKTSQPQYSESCSSSTPEHHKKKENLHEIRIKIKKLQMKRDYLSENSIDIPNKLLDELKNLKIEEKNLTSPEKIDCYIEIVSKFKELMKSRRVYEEMERFDRKTTREIDQLLMQL